MPATMPTTVSPTLKERHKLFNLLLARAGLTPNSLAAVIAMPTAQGNIWRYSKGEVADPRGKWVQAAATYLKVHRTALVDDDAARIEAERQGLSLNAANEPATRYHPPERKRQAGIDPGMLALQIADLMRGFSESQRRIAAPLFQGAAENPDEAPKIAAALRALLLNPEKQSATGT